MAKCHYLLSLLELFTFYFQQLFTLSQLPDEVKTGFYEVKKRQKVPKFTMSVEKSVVERYNRAMERERCRIRNLNPISFYSFRVRLCLLFGVRLTAITAACMGLPVKYVVIISCLQFAAAPYSFFVGFTWNAVLCVMLHIPHYLLYAVATCVLGLLPIESVVDFLTVPIDGQFIWAFFLIDQVICLIFCFYTPRHRSVTYPLGKSLVHFAYGNLNCKTYFLLMWSVLYGFRINGLIWLIDFSLGLTSKLAKFLGQFMPSPAILFYHMHRMAHLPEVYEHAHKLHHYLQGANAFDAHVFGAGMAEEWASLATEVGFALSFGLMPLALNPHCLWQSWEGKIRHTQFAGEQQDNHHWEHHNWHSKNFSTTCDGVLDMIFGTNADNYEVLVDGYRISRSDTDHLINITYTLLNNR